MNNREAGVMSKDHDAKEQKPDILVVDDETASLRFLTELLHREGYSVRPVNSARLAIKSALAHPPSLILLDVRMPGMSGFDVCRYLKQNEITCDIPVIFVSALRDIEDHIEGFDAGGVDFITKPLQEREILARVKTHVQLRDMQLNLQSLVSERTAELKKTNQRLRESEEKYRTLVEQASDGIVVIQDGNIVFTNSQMGEMVGYTKTELVDTPFGRYIADDDLQKVINLYNRRMRNEEVPSIYESVIQHKNGSSLEVEFNACLTNYNGKTADLVIVRNITERKRAEERLRESEVRFRATFEQAAVGFAHIATDGRFLRVNQRFCDIVGFSREEILEKTFQNITHLDDLDADLDHMHELLAGNDEYYSMEKRYIRKNGDIVWVNLTVSLFWKGTGEPRYIIAVVQDITERKQAEEALQQYQQRLKALASQLTIAEETERRRLSIALHDNVSQTLALTRMQISAVRKKNTDPKIEVLLDEISVSLLQALQDTQTLMFDLSSPLLNERGLEVAVSDWLEEQIGKKHGLETEYIDDGMEKPLDENMRSILFRNVRELLTNVLKHAQAKKVMVSLKRLDDHMQVIVKDDGIGFDTNEEHHSGKTTTGYGLFSIQERMADLGGTFEIHSKPDRGCEAILIAPLNTT